MKRTPARPLILVLFLLTVSQMLSAQSTTTGTVAIRQIFPRNLTYEYQILKALNYNPNPSLTNINLNETIKSYNQLSPLEKAFGQIALIAAEIHYMRLPNTTPESALRDIANTTIPEIKKQVIGYMAVLTINVIAQNKSDELSIALKGWATQTYKGFKIRVAKGILDEYNKWKVDPCGYNADGYKAPLDCALKGLNFTQWYSTHKPPEDILAKAGLKSAFGNNADALVSGIAMGLYAATISAAAVAVSSGLGVIVGSTIVNTTAAPILLSFTSLSSAFGSLGSAGMAGGATTGAIGATSWAGVVAAPVAAAILVIVVGTVEGIRVVEAEKVGPMLKMKLGVAMSSQINMTNEIMNPEAVKMFYLAFEESANKGFPVIEPKVDGEVRFYCQAGYVSRFKLTYSTNIDKTGWKPLYQPVEYTTKDLTVGNEETFKIPYDAKNIKIEGWYLAGTWKTLISSQSIAAPTYLCYTSYGTIFDAKYKTDCPEVGNMTTKPNELTVTQGGAYTAWVYLSYKQNGKIVIAQDQQGLTMGWRKTYQIPKDATQIYLYIRDATGLSGILGDPWKAVVEKTWPVPPNECIKIYGTTLDPKWNNECN